MRSRVIAHLSAFSLITVSLLACTDPVTSPGNRAVQRQALSSVLATGEGVPTDRHVFLMNGNSIPDGFASAVEGAGGKILRAHAEIGVAVTTGLSDAAADEIARGNGKVERDVRLKLVPSLSDLKATVFEQKGKRPDASIASALPPQAAAALSLQWGLQRIHAIETWTDRTGDPNVRVAIIDTGLDPDHLDQQGLIDEASSIAFTPSLSGPPKWADDHFHGTHVGATVTSNNFVTAGVVSNVTLIAIKVVTADGEGSISDIIAGLLWAAAVRADVANLSLGAAFPKAHLGILVAAFNRAVNYANRHDVLVVSAADNFNMDLQHDGNFIEIPCESGTVMCVSATNFTDHKASYSNYGSSAISVAAPGGDVDIPPPFGFILGPCSSHTTIPELADCKDRVTYLWLAGTSQAAPHVSGAAAFLDSQYGGALNPAQLQSKLQQCADDLGKPGTDQFYGNGRINVFNTVNEVNCNNSH